MSSNGSNIDFSFEYAVSIIVTLVVMSMLLKRTPTMNSAVVVIGGLAVAYITLVIMNYLFPKVNKVAQNVRQYFVYSIMTNFNNLGYLHVWPPILAVLIVFVVLLYNRNLG